MAVVAVVVGKLREIEVELVEVDQVAKRLLRRRVHGIELLRICPRLPVHCARREPAGDRGRDSRGLSTVVDKFSPARWWGSRASRSRRNGARLYHEHVLVGFRSMRIGEAQRGRMLSSAPSPAEHWKESRHD